METDDEFDIKLSGAQNEQADNKSPTTIVVDDSPDDRYSRLRLIPWWDQERMRAASVMVVGAGAIGNEIIKNLALLGIGRIFVVDMDRIENSNLSRSILYRASNEGEFKAEVAAQKAMEINPDILAQAFNGNVVYDLGLGVFHHMDVVLGGLDNREARLGINQACWKVNKPWVDGAIEALNGIARVFTPPDGPCYECTMNETDFKMLNQRRSCALLSRDEMLTGKVPTTPTTSSVIAGIQVQEAIKLIHARSDLPTLAGKGFFFNGLTHDSYVVSYERKDFCLSHETFDNIIETGMSAKSTTLHKALGWVRERLGPNSVLDFGREMVTSLECTQCAKTTNIFKQLGRVSETDGRCLVCGEMRTPRLTHSIIGDEPYLDLTLAEAGVPLFDILTGREGNKMIHFELTGDRQKALGILA